MSQVAADLRQAKKHLSNPGNWRKKTDAPLPHQTCAALSINIAESMECLFHTIPRWIACKIPLARKTHAVICCNDHSDFTHRHLMLWFDRAIKYAERNYPNA